MEVLYIHSRTHLFGCVHFLYSKLILFYINQSPNNDTEKYVKNFLKQKGVDTMLANKLLFAFYLNATINAVFYGGLLFFLFKALSFLKKLYDEGFFTDD